MNRSIIFLLLLVSGLWLVWACKERQAPVASAPVVATVAEEGVINCFASGLKNADSSFTFCEASAAVFYNGRLYVGNDKPVPGASPVFWFGYRMPLASPEVNFVSAPAFFCARKIEDFTIIPDARKILATTAFDRQKSTPEWDGYNCLLSWAPGNEPNVSIAGITPTRNPASSLSIKPFLARALRSALFPETMPYFKIEGLAAIPDNNVLFGVRETGASYREFQNTVILLMASYHFSNEQLVLDTTNFRKIYDWKIAENPDNLRLPIGLSSIEYDAYHQRLLMLTSHETASDTVFESYLWALSPRQILLNQPPELIRTPSGKPLIFGHKAEGLAIVDAHTLFVIHDDDEHLTFSGPTAVKTKTPNQAVYAIVKFQE